MPYLYVTPTDYVTPRNGKSYRGIEEREGDGNRTSQGPIEMSSIELQSYHYNRIGCEDLGEDDDGSSPPGYQVRTKLRALLAFVHQSRASWMILALVALIVAGVITIAIPSDTQEATVAPQGPGDGGYQVPPTSVNLFAKEYNVRTTTYLQIRRHNYHSKTIPTQIGFLTNLEFLDLQQNQLIGQIPSEVGLLTKLTAMRLNSNHLWHQIPSEIGLLSMQLEDLSLRDNKLQGTLPSQIGLLSKLTRLHVGNNQLSGSLPSEVGCLTAMTDASFMNNQIAGSIPSELGNMGKSIPMKQEGQQVTAVKSLLTKLELHDNKLTGSVPSELGLLNHLMHLTLYHNRLSGSVPAALCSNNNNGTRRSMTRALPVHFDQTPSKLPPTQEKEEDLKLMLMIAVDCKKHSDEDDWRIVGGGMPLPTTRDLPMLIMEP